MMPKPMRRGASTVRRLPARTLERLPAADAVVPGPPPVARARPASGAPRQTIRGTPHARRRVSHFGEFRALVPVFVLTLALAVSVAFQAPAAAGEPPLVAAAASLRHVFPALSRAWVDAGGGRPEVSFGSSGNLYRQIAQGAPFDLFLSADEKLARKLVVAGGTDGEGIVYGLGRLALLVPRHSRLALDPTLADLARALDDGRLRRLAIANPAHAPYGRAAREALVRTALWPRLGDRLLLAENAAQAVQFALARAADGGIVPRALVISERVSRNARHALLDAAMHGPIAHRMVLLERAGAQARALFRFLASPQARDVFERFGFGAPRAHGPFPSRSVSLAPRRGPWERGHLVRGKLYSAH